MTAWPPPCARARARAAEQRERERGDTRASRAAPHLVLPPAREHARVARARGDRRDARSPIGDDAPEGGQVGEVALLRAIGRVEEAHLVLDRVARVGAFAQQRERARERVGVREAARERCGRAARRHRGFDGVGERSHRRLEQTALEIGVLEERVAEHADVQARAPHGQLRVGRRHLTRLLGSDPQHSASAKLSLSNLHKHETVDSFGAEMALPAP